MNPENNTNHEEVKWQGTVSNWHYKGAWMMVLILVLAACASFFVNIGATASSLWLLRGGLVLVALLTVGWIKLDQSRRKYLVTNKRVVVEFGIIAKSSNEVRVQDIRSINLTKTGISGLLGIGRVEFSSAATDDADVIFWNCPESERVRDLVRSLQV